MQYAAYKPEVASNGFAVIENIYSEDERLQIINVIEGTDTSGDTFRKSENLFAIRQFVKEIPQALPLIFNEKLRQVISQVFGEDYFIVKSIYFDKPGGSNWFVAYHQDLTVSVDKKTDVDGYGPWTVKQNQFAVQPPLHILENIFTLRLHLDDTDINNGALKVVPGSHAKGIYRPETIDWQTETEAICNVPAGGLMIMKPLLLHSSGRTTNNNNRRVIHIEFSNHPLATPLQWAEKMIY
ncbi:phytanoyl-CoA dioxygenase [Flavobacterium akiainvivens]|uniref:Phytanoyl-CoA dioxygenase n=1 Tax=Flavobacterium akiainvivens TaxID=1202724 RepID=A0A0M8M9D2_9FLAO|nr:phytanoyl-CoA dioxygenase family protein [Flavobacterium akiainvivens]KOS05245.1 phytanoyl-CoA dioxygenase [Flavobacterium akiainvivens]SFQ50235.1 Phytanoyl-CoA dioxygenase (PhyH) [Flavobacterium akiainvivens]